MPVADPQGRQPIGVDQPPGSGTNYPFVQPSLDIQYLLGDLFLSFDDLSDTYEFPLKVSWLFGFGVTVVAPPAGYPTPTHARDIIVTDVNDVVVFDSTTASKFTEDPWDNRLLILEWTTSDRILRCVQHTAWSQADIDSGQDRDYDTYIEPTNGVLQADTWFKMPKRVTSIQVGLTNISTTKLLTFSEGYNISLNKEASGGLLGSLDRFIAGNPVSPGQRASTALNIAASPGAGLGVFPGCGDQILELKTVNRIRSNDYQNFTYDSEGCIRSQRPVGLIRESPREFNYASLVLPASQAVAAIETLNDCQNCCDCTYFAQTYQGIKRQWFLYEDVAVSAESTRDLYRLNIGRWEVQKAIREVDTLRIRVNMDGNCKVGWGFAHCNASRCCILGVTAHVTFLYYLNGVLTSPTEVGYDCKKSEIDGSEECDGAVPTVLDVNASGQYATATWDYADPQTVTTVRGRFCFPDCASVATDALKVQMHVVIAWENSSDDPATGSPCTYPLLTSSDYPADVIATWSALGIAVPTFGRVQSVAPLTSVSSDNPFCSRCECTETGTA
jgi:hypothetical protein|tara:strand:- start:3200 stop:4873 length:1674 start_codon:yes stop_codon:yes gene_type:complete